MNRLLALCVLLTSVMLFHSQKKGHAQKSTEKAPGVVNVTPEGITTASVYLEEKMSGKNTTNAPNPQNRMHVKTTQESPNAESGKDKGTMQKSPNQEGALDEEESFSNEIEQTVEPHRWLCLKKKYRTFSIKIHCSCDPLCVLYGDCCYGMPENTEVCAASTKIKKPKSSLHSKTVLASNLTVTEVNSTTLVVSHNKTSSWEWHEKPVNPVAISLALKSSCRNRPQLKKRLPQYTPNVDRNGPKFWMVDQCPSSWLDEKIRLKCTDTSNTTLSEDVLLHQPVTDPDTMITFRNKYCAACNGIENGLEPWGLVVSCRRTLIRDFLNCSSSACLLRKLEKEKCNGIFEPNPEWNLRMCFREIENDAFGPCKVRLINGSVYFLPLPLPLHSALRDACLAYNNPAILDGLEGTEKNYHCMVCYYGLQFCDDIYKPLDDYRAKADLSFRALLYVGDLNRNQDDDVMTMPQAPQSTCPPLFVPEGQNCRPLLNFTIVRHYFQLNFVPFGWLPSPGDGCNALISSEKQIKDVFNAANAVYRSCSPQYDEHAANRTVVFKVMAMVSVTQAGYEQGRQFATCTQAWIERALKNKQLHLYGRPIRIRPGNYPSCEPSTTSASTTHPLRFASTTETSTTKNQGHIRFVTNGLVIYTVMVAITFDL